MIWPRIELCIYRVNIRCSKLSHFLNTRKMFWNWIGRAVIVRFAAYRNKQKHLQHKLNHILILDKKAKYLTIASTRHRITIFIDLWWNCSQVIRWALSWLGKKANKKYHKKKGETNNCNSNPEPPVCSFAKVCFQAGRFMFQLGNVCFRSFRRVFQHLKNRIQFWFKLNISCKTKLSENVLQKT